MHHLGILAQDGAFHQNLTHSVIVAVWGRHMDLVTYDFQETNSSFDTIDLLVIVALALGCCVLIWFTLTHCTRSKIRAPEQLLLPSGFVVSINDGPYRK